MITLRPAAARGATRFPWLDSRHSFSFGGYRDPAHVHFGPLRVINDDRIQGGGGFPPHSHEDMEIVTYMVEGALAHEDSTGGRGVIGAGEVQRMTAGTGITHSEFNASKTEPARLLQIWLIPDAEGLPPAYGQKRFAPEDRKGRLVAVASGRGTAGALPIHQDAEILAAALAPGQALAHEIAPTRRAWVQVVSGRVTVNGRALEEGDGAAVEGERRLDLAAPGDGRGGGEVLVFDLP